MAIKINEYKKYLNNALERLFSSTENNGFWFDKENRLISLLRYNITDQNTINWFPDYSINWRYPPFALMSIMYWRNSIVSNDYYDIKIKEELKYFIDQINNEQVLSEIPSYGIGPLIVSFSLAYQVFNNENYKKIAIQLYKYSKKKFNFSNSEDCLLLYGWGFLYEIYPSSSLKEDMHYVLKTIISKQNKKGLFIFKNLLTTKKHQNQMYILWGIGKAIEVLQEKKYLINIEKTLDYTIKNRMLPNGALLWEDHVFWLRKVKNQIMNREPGWNYLFECHQTFFINAVFQYYKAGGQKKYNIDITRAMNWIFGNNILQKNLVEISGIGVPLRMMLIDGKLHISRQRFKGAYEIGSYIMALTNLLIEEISNHEKQN
jgi:hypothetical protein